VGECKVVEKDLSKFDICLSQMQIGCKILGATSCQTVGFLTNRPKWHMPDLGGRAAVVSGVV